METTLCNLCQNSEATLLFTVADLQLNRLDGQYRYVCCTRCGLIFLNPQPTLAELTRAYPDEYDSYEAALQPKTGWLNALVRQYGIEKRCKAVLRYKHTGHLLDVGCASGSFLLGMQRHPGWQVEGVDISAYAANLARKIGLKVTNSTLEAATFPEHTFDVVTLWDVLEHLQDPVASLAEIKRILKPNGLLVLRVPNGNSWGMRIFGSNWAGVDAPRHLYIFTPLTIRRSLESQGFEILDMHCRIGSYSFFILSVRFWFTARQRSATWRKAMDRILGNPITRLITAPIFTLSNLGKHGSALIVVAQAG